MPLVGPVLGAGILAKFAQFGFTGAQATNFAMAVGNGVVNNILATNLYVGTGVGTGPGAGVGTGKVSGVVGPIVGQNIYTFMVAKGFSGSQLLNKSMAIGMAFAEHITALGIVNSISAPTAVGVGTGVIQGVIGIPMGQMIFTFFSASGFTGAQALNEALAIGEGIALSMTTAIVNTTIVGVPAPPPTGPVPIGGVDNGKLI